MSSSSGSNFDKKDPTKEHSESEKRKAKEASQLQPENCQTETGGSCVKMPDRFEELMKVAGKFHQVIDYKVLFNTKPKYSRPDPVDPSIDFAALCGPPAINPGPVPVDPEKQAAILKREKEWEEDLKKEEEKSEEEKEKDEKERQEMKIKFQKAVDKFYGKKPAN